MNRTHTDRLAARLLVSLALVAALALAGLAAFKNYFSTSAVSAQVKRPRGGASNLVRGYIAANVGGAAAQPVNAAVARAADKDIYLPGVDVFLRDERSQQQSNVSRTDLSGRFTLYATAPGRFNICWKSDAYGDGCTKEVVSAGAAPRFVSTVRIQIPPRRDYVALTGHVTNADGSLPRAFDPLLNINAFATVGLEDAKQGRPAAVYVNNFGDYLLPYVPAREKFKVTAAIEAARLTREVWPESSVGARPVSRLDFKIQNSRPQLNPLLALDGSGRSIQKAAPGAQVTLRAEARDRDGDEIKYIWFTEPDGGRLARDDSPKQSWTPPARPGRHSVTVVAYDGKGGYDKAVLSVTVGGGGVPFTGIVVEPGGAPVGDAEVEVVGNPVVRTDAAGRFHTFVAESDRYVLNIRKAGYALNSQVYDRGVTGGRWFLRRGQVVTVDPKRDSPISHRRGERDCVGPQSARAGLGAAGDSLVRAQWQDGKGNVVDAPERATDLEQRAADFRRAARGGVKAVALNPRALRVQQKCGPGVSVMLPANSVVDASGNPVTAPFSATVSTVDLLSPQQMPGDDTVVSGRRGGNIESFGAGALDLPAGYRLRPGATATVVIPVDRSRLTGEPLPPTVPYLSYDEKRGLWVEEGTMTLKNVGGVQSYVAQAKHFSPFNADNVKNNTAACLRVFSPTLPGHYDLEVTAPLGGTGAPKVLTKEIDNTASSEHVIYNLPNNVNVTLAPMTQGASPQLLGFYVVNSGQPQNPNNSPNVPPGPPYTSCQNFVVLKTGAAPDTPFGGEFLHGLGNIAGVNLGFNDLTSAAPTGNALTDAVAAASRNYYAQVDPGNQRATFADFKALHGFSQDPNTPVAGEVVAQYANSGDLGFGRDMHCLKKLNNDVVCYVTNYGNGYVNSFPGEGTDDHDDAEAAAARATVGASAEVATVAMEFSALPPLANKVVKFFVYKKDFPNAGDYGRSISANLDGRGERPVPQLCMICHGGQVPSQAADVPAFGNAAQVDLGARFVPFDHRLFTFPAAPGKAAQEAAIKTLNEQIVNFAPPAGTSDPIHEVVAGMYNNGASSTQILNFDVPGWAAGASDNLPNQSNVYRRVVANGCRTCHTSQPFPQLQFNTSEKLVERTDIGDPGNRLMLGTAQLRMCGDYTMPHAFRTHEVVWGAYTDIDPLLLGFSMPVEFQTFGDGVPGIGATSNWKTGLCTSFVSNLAAQPSNFYQQTIQPIFNAKCTYCHLPAGGLYLGEVSPPNSPASSWRQLLDGGRVIPGDDNGSLLVQKITSNGGNRMPPGCWRAPAPPNGNLPCLSQPDIDRIKAWIRSGAN